MSDTDVAAGAERAKQLNDTQMFSLAISVWGEYLHMGLFENPGEVLEIAAERATARMAADAGITLGQKILEVACGIGGNARYLAHALGADVTATNISWAQLARAQELTDAAGLSDHVTYGYADFHDLPYDDDSFDCWWCHEALLFAVDRRRVFSEALRVTKPGGRLVVSDLLFRGNPDPVLRDQLVERLGAGHTWKIDDYDRLFAEMGLDITHRYDWSDQVFHTMQYVTQGLTAKRDEFAAKVGPQPVDEAIFRITVQRDLARAGNMGWAVYIIGN